MSRSSKYSSPIRDQQDGHDMFATMIAMSPHPWYILSSGLVSPTKAIQSREEMIVGTMSIPTYYARIDERGHSVMGEPEWMTREQAERFVDGDKHWKQGNLCSHEHSASAPQITRHGMIPATADTGPVPSSQEDAA